MFVIITILKNYSKILKINNTYGRREIKNAYAGF